MNSTKIKRSISLILLVVIAVTFSSCAGFRRKFVREKKQEKSDKFIPVLEPEDYASSPLFPKERYMYHYRLWKTWNKELNDAVTKRDSTKRLKFLLDKLIQELVALKKWVDEDRQALIHELAQDLEAIRPEIEKPVQIRKTTKIIRKLEHNAKEVRVNFGIKAMEGYFPE